jgi:multiple sugar transport system permease protein
MTTEIGVREQAPRARSTVGQKEALWGYVCILPWIIGFVAFFLGPMLYSFYGSFTKWNIIGTPRWVGLENYLKIMTDDRLFGRAIRNTVYYTLVSVPLGLVAGLLVSLLLNVKVKGIQAYRTIYYLPSVLPVVSVVLLWQWIFNPRQGILNRILEVFGIEGPRWLADPDWAIPALIIMGLWGVGGGVVIYLAGLKSIPQHLYEAARIDGAGVWQRFIHVTLPMMTPTLFFNLITGIIGAFQIFTTAFILFGAQGGSGGNMLFFVTYLYRRGFVSFQLGYASALAWILFFIVLALTVLVFRSSAFWVYYEGELRK